MGSDWGSALGEFIFQSIATALWVCAAIGVAVGLVIAGLIYLVVHFI